MGVKIREMTMNDYESAHALWEKTEGIGLSQADERANIASFLVHNRGLSFVAEAGGALVGALLGSFDGRRGYLHHLAVAPGFRRDGIGRALVEHSLESLRGLGVRRCHIFVKAENDEGKKFWRKTGWVERFDITAMSRDLPA